MAVNEYDEIVDSIQKEQAPQAANPYEDIVNEDKQIQGQVIRASLLGSIDKNPDEQANAIKLAERTKLPIGTVTRNYNNVKKKDILATTDYDKIIEETPALAKLISDPNTAAAVHDDLDKLGRVEATANRLKPLSEEGSLSDIKNAMGSGFNSMLGSTGHLFALFDAGVDRKDVYKYIAERNKAAQDLRQKYPEYYKKFEETRQKEWADVTEGTNQLKKSIEEFKNNDIKSGLMDFAAGGATTVGQALDYVWAHVKNPKSSAIMMSEQISQNAPSYTLGIAGGATGTATGAALGTATVPIIGTISGAALLGGAGAYSGAFMGGVMTEVGSEMNQLLEQKGYDITSAESLEKAYSNPELIKELKDMAIRKGVTTSAVDSLFTVVAGRFLSKAKGTGIVSKAKAFGKEVAAQTVGESGSELAGQVAEYKGDISKIDPQSVFDEGLLSLGHSMKEVVTHAGIKSGKVLGIIPLRKQFSEDPVRATEELADKNKQAFKATSDAETLKTLGEQVKETKTKVRIPEKISELLDTATQGRGTENVYFQKDAWDNYWNGKGINPARAFDQIMGSSKKYNEVEETGGQLSLPLSKYVTQLVDTEHYEGLLADTMTAPDSMSLRDAKNLFENNSALLNTFANESLKSTAEKDIESTPEFKQVYDDIYRQAKEAGRSTREAENLALINARQTAIRANIRGQKLEDFYKGMQIQYFDTPAQVEAGQFTQAPPEVVQERSRLSELSTSTFKAHQEAKKERESVKKVLLDTLKTKLPEEQATKLINDLTAGVTRGMMYDAAQAIRNVAPDLDVESYMAANDKYYATLSSDRIARDKFNQFSDKNRTYFQGEYSKPTKKDINSKEFKKWFGKSKVKDEDGKPLVVYHGGIEADKIEVFSKDYAGQTTGNNTYGAFHFVAEKEVAEDYSRQSFNRRYQYSPESLVADKIVDSIPDFEGYSQQYGFVEELANERTGTVEAYLKIENPIVIDNNGERVDVGYIERLTQFALTGTDENGEFEDYYTQYEKKKIDGIIIKNMIDDISPQSHIVSDQYIVFNPNQIKSVYNKGSFSHSSDNIYYQTRQVVDTFYSKMIKTVEEKMGTTASVEQVNGMLKEIKPEERKWMQLDEFLKGKTKVSKEELLNFLNANQLKIEEVGVGTEFPLLTRDDLTENEDLPEDVEGLTREWRLNVPEGLSDYIEYVDISEYNGDTYEVNYNGNVIGSYPTLGKALQAIEQKTTNDYGVKFNAVSSGEGKAMYGEYTLSGGENYREVKFKLPVNKQKFAGLTMDAISKALGYGGWHDSLTENQANEVRAAYEAQPYGAGEGEKIGSSENLYTSGHFKGEPNILAFTRLKDRVDADGKKVLFIEEIQSDWHHEGRKKGYKAGIVLKNFPRFLNENKGMNVTADEATEIFKNKDSDLVKEYHAYQDSAYKDESAVPDAPLKKTWHEFVLKRLIREAAEKGYDKIAWTTGEQQAARYDVSKQIDKVIYNKNTSTIGVFKNGDNLMKKKVPIGELDAVIGKEIAQKISDSKENHVHLEGLDLKIGGEGLRFLYDSLYKDFLNKFGKKYGAKVEDTKINMPQVVEYTGYKKYGEEFKWAIQNSDGSILSEYKGDPNLFRSKEAAQDYIKENNMNDGQKVHSLEITPALKEAALYEGFTLFQKESDLARGQIRIGNTKLNIDIFKDANESTLFHESGHAFLENMKDDFKFISELDQTKLTETQKDFLARAKDVLEWLGVDSFDALEREHHEKWARGFEAYLMEGKAPTSKLRAAFAAFKVWLVNIYRQLRNLNVELSPEIRSVMDRLVATEEEIQTEMGASEMKPLFGDPKFQGMSEENVKKYLKAQEEAQNYAKEQVEQKVLKQYMRTKESWYKEKRDAIKADIDKDLNSRRVYKALSILQKGKMPDGSELPQGVMAIKIDKDSLVRKYGKEILDRLPKPYVYKKEGGVDVDMAASMLGYEDANTMIQEIANAPKKDLLSKQMTDAKMNELYPDMMLTNELPEEVKKALHNEKRVEMLRMELEHLASNNMPVLKEGIRRITKMPPTNKQVKAEAFKKVSSLDVQDIKPNQFLKAEQKARKEAGELFTKGDLEGAFDAKLKELLNHEMYNVAVEVKEKIEKDKELFKKFQRKDEDIAKTRDMDLVNAGRAVLAQYGIGKMDKAPSEYLDLIKQYDPEMYDHVSTLVEEAVRPVQDRLAMKDNYKSISYRDYLNFSDTIKTIWDLAKSTRETELDGVKLDIGTMANELSVETMQFLKEKTGDQRTTATTKDRAIRFLLGARAALRRVESWCDYMDGGKANGIFKKYIFNMIAKSTADYRLDKNYYINKYLDNLKKIEGSLKDQKPIDARELGQGVVFNSKSDLITALLHTGNESNLSKLLRGRNWGILNADGSLDKSKWNKFMARMYAEKIVTKADYDFAQSVWDLMEEMKPKLQKAHKKMYGYYFNEVTADEVDTPFGKYKGGYVPAKADPFYSNDAASRAMKEMLEKNSNSYAFPTTTRGSTKQRVEAYAAPLNLNLRMVVSHIDWAARFANIEPKVKDVIRIIKNKELKSALYEIDPTLLNDMFNPWLQRAATQQVSFSSEGNAGALLDNIARGLRKRTGMNAMFANITNTIQQITGFSITAVKVKPRNIRNAMWTYMQKPNKVAAEIRSKSKFMQTRTDNSLADNMNTIEEITLNPSKYEKFVDFAQKHAYFFQSTAQNFVDNVSWMGAYNQAIENNMSEQDAINYADSVVRLTQGSQAAEDVSRYETGTPFMRLFTMFYSYFNMQSNLLGTEFAVAMRDLGLKKGAGRALYVYTLGFMIPAVMSELLVLGMSGKGLDEDDDDQYLDDAMQLFFGSQFNTLTAMVPMAGSTIKPAIGAFTSKPYDDKISSSPAVTSIEATVRAPADIYKVFFEDGSKKKAVQDTLTAIALITGVPVSALGRPAGYLFDVNEGKANPSNPIDYTRGLITGKSGK